MRYLGHGIGHQNQDARWTSELNDDMDTDPDFEEDIGSGGSPEENSDSQLEGLRELAMKMISQPAGDDDEDVDSDDSEDSEEYEGLDKDNLFFDGDSRYGEDSEDDKDGGDDDEFDFGPHDGEGEDGDDDGAEFKEARYF